MRIVDGETVDCDNWIGRTDGDVDEEEEKDEDGDDLENPHQEVCFRLLVGHCI